MCACQALPDWTMETGGQGGLKFEDLAPGGRAAARQLSLRKYRPSKLEYSSSRLEPCGNPFGTRMDLCSFACAFAIVWANSVLSTRYHSHQTARAPESNQKVKTRQGQKIHGKKRRANM
jgi:hypothetical protein